MLKNSVMICGLIMLSFTLGYFFPKESPLMYKTSTHYDLKKNILYIDSVLKYTETIKNSNKYYKLQEQNIYLNEFTHIKITYSGGDVLNVYKYDSLGTTSLYENPWKNYSSFFSFKNPQNWKTQSVNNIKFFAEKCLGCHYFRENQYLKSLSNMDKLNINDFTNYVFKTHTMNDTAIIIQHTDEELSRIKSFIKLIKKEETPIP